MTYRIVPLTLALASFVAPLAADAQQLHILGETN